MTKRAIYAGTFDPLTLGHTDIIHRAACLFDEVIVAVSKNPKKSPVFSVTERVELSKKALVDQQNVRVIGFDGLLYQFAIQENAQALIRGVRTHGDFEYELQMAQMNRHYAPHIETIFFMSSEKYQHVSSSLVREIASLHGDVAAFLPPVWLAAIKKKFKG